MESVFIKARPTLRDAHDCVVFALHSDMIASHFRCIGLTEDPDEKADLPLCPPGWNTSKDVYCFKYIHPDDNDDMIVIKFVRMDKMLMVHASSRKNNQIHTLTLNANDYVNTPTNLSKHDTILKDTSRLSALFTHNIKSKLTPEKKIEKTPNQTSDPLRIDRKRYQPPDSLIDPDDGFQQGFPFPMAGGDFDRDLNPFPGIGVGPLGGGMGRGGVGGNLFGPDRFPQGLGPRPGPRRPFQPGYDPMGPFAGPGGEPDPDHMRVPGRRGGFPPFM